MAALSLWFPASIALVMLMPRAWVASLAPDAVAAAVLLLRLCVGRASVLVLLPALLALVAAGQRLDDRLPTDAGTVERLVELSVCGFPATHGRITRFTGRPHDAGLPPQVSVSWFDAPPGLQTGSVWRVRLRLRAARRLHGGVADRERSDFLRGIGARASVRRSTLNKAMPGARSRCPLDALRAGRAADIGDAVGATRSTPWLQALGLAVRGGLSERDWQLLRATGTTHLVAISGLHIGLVAGLAGALGRGLGFLLAWLPRAPSPRILAMSFALPAALVYAAMAGFSTPTLRALTMLCLATGLLALRRAVRPWRLLAATLCCVLFIQPLSLLEAGFWLSFLAVAALMLPVVAVPVCRAPGALRRVWSVQWRICLCLGPLGLFLFGGVSLTAPVVNLLAIPLFAFLIVPAVLAGSLLLPTAAGQWLLQLAAAALEVTIAGLELLAGLPGLLWQARAAPIFLTVAGLAAVLLAWPRPAPRSWVVALLLLPLSIQTPANRAELRVQVVDVGQGLAVLVRTRNHALLYDTGPSWSGGSAARSRLLPLLRKLDLRRLDDILVSHSDTDHAGGVELLTATFPRARVSSPQALGPVAARDCSAGQSWTWDGVRFTVLHPGLRQRRLQASDNDLSCVLLVETASARLLLTGDISRRAEAAMLRRYPRGPVDLLLAPHHGSRSSSGPALVAATRPRYVVFAAGYRNRWGFPHAEVAGRWRDIGSCLLSSGEHGSLYFTALPGESLRLRRASRRDARGLWTVGAIPATCDDPVAPVK